MDTIDMYRKIIKNTLSKYVHTRYAYGDIHNQTIFDESDEHYLVMSLGWQPAPAMRNTLKRVHGALIHVDIIDGKIWIQRDGTEQGIASELVAAGIPQNQIVLGFYTPDVRPYTEFAVA